MPAEERGVVGACSTRILLVLTICLFFSTVFSSPVCAAPAVYSLNNVGPGFYNGTKDGYIFSYDWQSAPNNGTRVAFSSTRKGMVQGKTMGVYIRTEGYFSRDCGWWYTAPSSPISFISLYTPEDHSTPNFTMSGSYSTDEKGVYNNKTFFRITDQYPLGTYKLTTSTGKYGGAGKGAPISGDYLTIYFDVGGKVDIILDNLGDNDTLYGGVDTQRTITGTLHMKNGDTFYPNITGVDNNPTCKLGILLPNESYVEVYTTTDSLGRFSASYTPDLIGRYFTAITCNTTVGEHSLNKGMKVTGRAQMNMVSGGEWPRSASFATGSLARLAVILLMSILLVGAGSMRGKGRGGLMAFIIFGAVLSSSFHPVEAVSSNKLTTWTNNIEVRTTSGGSQLGVTAGTINVNPGDTIWINTTLSGSTDQTAGVLPIVKLNVPEGFNVTPQRFSQSASQTLDFYNFKFYDAEQDWAGSGTLDWYIDAEEILADDTTWNTGYRVTAPMVPGNYTVSIALYDYDSQGGTDYFDDMPAEFQGWGDKNYTVIQVVPNMQITTLTTNATTYQLDERTDQYSVAAEGFQIGQTVRIDLSTSEAAKLNVTVWKPKYAIGMQWLENDTVSNSGVFEYPLCPGFCEMGIYTVEVVSYSSGGNVARNKTNFYVGRANDSDYDIINSFRSKRISPPDTSYTCGECHTTVYIDDVGHELVYGSGTLSDPQNKHPDREAPTENCEWIHKAHDPLPQLNLTRTAAAADYDIDSNTNVGANTPGSVAWYGAFENGNFVSPDFNIAVMYGGDAKYPDHDQGWDTCSICHVEAYWAASATTRSITLSCENTGGGSQGCHIIERAGAHAASPTCEACHVPDEDDVPGASLKDVYMPECTRCHGIDDGSGGAVWKNGTTPSLATLRYDTSSVGSGVDKTSAVSDQDGTTATTYTKNNPANVLDAAFGPPYRLAAYEGRIIQLQVSGTVTGTLAGVGIGMYTVGGTWKQLYYQTALGDAATFNINVTVYDSTLDAADEEAGLHPNDELWHFVINDTMGADNNNYIDIDRVVLNALVKDSIQRMGAHEGVDCLNCHGHSHNASKDFYCTDCKGNVMAPTDVHTWAEFNGKNATSGYMQEMEVNTTRWCSACHGGDEHSFITNTPTCSNCHFRDGNNYKSNDTHNRTWSPSLIPPWVMNNTHGRADYWCEDCHKDNHDVRKPTCGQDSSLTGQACHVANFSLSPPYYVASGINTSNWYATWIDELSGHSQDHSSGNNYTLKNHAWNSSGWKNGQQFGATCDQCHDNMSVKVWNQYKSPGQLITINLSTLIHATNGSAWQWGKRMKPINQNTSNEWAKYCVDCHTGYNTSHQGSNCGTCHSDGEDSNRPIFHSAVILKSGGNQNCSSCHDVNNGTATPINFASFALGMHSGLNRRAGDPSGSLNYDSVNSPVDIACWGCHQSDGTGSGANHPDKQNTPYECADCHLNVSNDGLLYSGTITELYSSAPMVAQHYPVNYTNTQISNNSLIVTNTSTGQDAAARNATCEYCHEASIGDTTGTKFNNIDSSIMANVSHFGTAGGLQETTDCLSCHAKSGNDGLRARYGVGPDIGASNARQDHSGDSYNQCDGCHSNGSIVESFHESPLNIAGGSGDCYGNCHDETHANPVNYTAFNNSIHRWINLANATAISTAESINRACRGCHVSDGSSAHYDQRAYTCWDCHGGTRPYQAANNAPTVYEHRKGADEINAVGGVANINESCLTCHNYTEMLVADANVGSGGSYTASAMENVSHFGKNRSQVGDNKTKYYDGKAMSTNCSWCHQDSTVFPMTAANRSIVGHTKNSDITTNDTDCLICHYENGGGRARIHDQALTTPTTVTAISANDFCAPCHDTAGNSYSSKIVYAHNNTWSNVTDCGRCHDSSYASGKTIKVHSTTLVAISEGTSTNCSECHQDTDTAGSVNVWAHTNKPGSNTVAVNSTDCAICHKQTMGAFTGTLHEADIMDAPAGVSAWTGTNSQCAGCHDSGGTRSVLKVTGHDESYNQSTLGCDNCHDSDSLGTNANVYLGAHNNTLQEYQEGTSYLCANCHQGADSYGAVDVYGHTTVPGATGVAVNASGCAMCHNSTYDADDFSAGETLHGSGFQRTPTVSTWQGTNSECAPCHESSGSGSILKVTGHDNTYNQSTLTCDNCHDYANKGQSANVSLNVHNSTLREWEEDNSFNCDVCHQNATETFYSAAQVYAHTNDPQATGVAVNTTDCGICHSSPMAAYTSSNTLHNVTTMQRTPAVSTWAGTNSECAPCHVSGGAGSYMKVYAHNETFNQSTLTCDNCHDSASGVRGQAVNASLNAHNISLREYREDISGNCDECHQNATDFFSAVQVEAHTNAPGSTGVAVNGTDCALCHNSTYSATPFQASNSISLHNASIRKSYPGYDIWTSGRSDYCKPCHAQNTGGSVKKAAAHNGSDIGTGPDGKIIDCGFCHYNKSTNGVGQNEINLRVHNSTLIKDSATYNCSTCHTNTTIQTQLVNTTRIIQTHYPGASSSGYKANTSESDWTSCEVCHGLANFSNSLHSTSLSVPTSSCVDCHQNTSGAGPNRGVQYNQSLIFNNFAHEKTQTAYCNDTCHETQYADDRAKFHFTDNPLGEMAYPNGEAGGWFDIDDWIASPRTVNCTDCHVNASLMQPFNVTALMPPTAPSSVVDHTVSSPQVSDCLGCHGQANNSYAADRPNAVHTVETPGGPDCILCHKIGGSANTEVNHTAVGLSVHGSIDSVAGDYGINESCYACHDDSGAAPAGGMGDKYQDPWACIDCHLPGKAKAGVYGAPLVYEHFINGTDVNATKGYTNVNDSCLGCHNLTEMIVQNGDTGSGSFDDDYGVLDPAYSAYHYAKNRSDMRVRGYGNGNMLATNCGYCHQNTSSVFKFNNSANMEVYAHSNSTLAEVKVNDSDCALCHYDNSGGYRIHDAGLSMPTVTATAWSNDDYCLPCHDGSIITPPYASLSGKVDAYDAHANETNSQNLTCSWCHKNGSLRQNTEVRVHTSMKHDASITCIDCHTNATTDQYVNTSRIIKSHYPGADSGDNEIGAYVNTTNQRGNTSESDYTECESCHTASGAKVGLHSATFYNAQTTSLAESNCTTCHWSPVLTSDYNSSQTRLAAKINHTYNTTGYFGNMSSESNQVMCLEMCHNATGKTQFHFDEYASGDTGAPRRWGGAAQYVNGTEANCLTCHRIANGTVPFTRAVGYEFENLSVTTSPSGQDLNQLHDSYALSDCYGCHVNKTSGIVKVDIHNVFYKTTLTGGRNCTGCHQLNSPYIGKYNGSNEYPTANLKVNTSAINSSVHGMVNKNLTGARFKAFDDEQDKMCWGCHATPDESGNLGTPTHPIDVDTRNVKVCEDCHMDSPTQIYPGATEVQSGHTVRSSKIKASVCGFCHNNSLVGNGDFSNGATNDSWMKNGNATAAHYAVTTYLVDGRNCASCHKNATTGSAYGNAPQIRHGDSNVTDYVVCSKCHNTSVKYYTPGTHDSSGNSPLIGPFRTLHDTNVSNATDKTIYSSVHYQFDWEGDDAQDLGGQGRFESCVACHNDTGQKAQAGDYSIIKVCENCHLEPDTDGAWPAGPWTGVGNDNWQLRKDWIDEDTSLKVPVVREHIFNASGYYQKSNINVSNLSSLSGFYPNTAVRNSSCYAYDNTTGAGACHGVSYSYRNVAGGYYAFGEGLTLNRTNDTSHYQAIVDKGLPDTRDCTSICHGSTDDAQRKAWGNATYVNSTTHGLTSQDCYNCHVEGGDEPFNFHNQTLKRAGGPDCVGCHNITSNKALIVINYTVFNASIHGLIDDTSQNDPTLNKSEGCWLCHNDGNQPGEFDHNTTKYRQPKNCTDCHLVGGSFNSETSAYGGANVSNHYTGIGENITAGVTDCLDCHSLGEMRNTVSDPDNGTFSIYTGIKGGNQSVSHYGKKRPDMVSNGVAVCYDCHKNTTTAFPFVTTANNNVSNHTQRTSGPRCDNSSCHGAGRIHDVGLKKPSAVDTTCQQSSCHASREQHGSDDLIDVNDNNDLNCTDCHMDEAATTNQIHGIKYLNTSGGFSTSNLTAANCTTCHIDNVTAVFTATGKTPPVVMSHKNLTHSDDYGGQKWNQSSGVVFWDNTTTSVTANYSCWYCHSNSKHNSSALGPLSIALNNGTTYVNGTINTTSRWCASCHDQEHTQYIGNLYNPIPPGIRDGMANYPAQDAHIGIQTDRFPHNSSLANGNDDFVCKGCHGILLGDNPTIDEFSHYVAVGGGGPNCTDCHDLGQSTPKINVTALKAGIHGGIENDSVSDYDDSEPCWVCHGDGSEPVGHPDTYKQPKNCSVCHLVNGINRSYALSVTSAAVGTDLAAVGGHYYGALSNNISIAYNCSDCHHRADMLQQDVNDPNNITDTVLFQQIYPGWNGGDYSFSHYGKNRSSTTDMVMTYGNGVKGTNCSYCHQDTNAPFPFINAANKNIDAHTNSSASAGLNTNDTDCLICHYTRTGEARFHASSITKPTNVQAIADQDYCAPCHNTSGNVYTDNIIAEHNTSWSNISSCSRCHDSSYTSGKVLKVHNATLTVPEEDTSYNCSACHQDSSASDLTGAKDVYTHTANTKGVSNINVSSLDCATCHSDARVAFNSSITLHRPYVKETPLTSAFGGLTLSECAPCHESSGAGSEFSSLNVTGHNESFNNGENLDCSYCHESQNEGSGGVSINVHNSTLTVYQQDNSYNCDVCHQNATDMFNADQVYAHTTSGTTTVQVNASNCALCHNQTYDADSFSAGETLHGSSLKKVPTTTANWSGTKSECFPCHDPSGSGSIKKVYGHNQSYNDAGDLTCDNCHDSGALGNGANNSLNVHSSTLVEYEDSTSYNCSNCHQNTTDLYSAAEVYAHTANAANPGTANVTTNASDCGWCHRTDTRGAFSSGDNLHNMTLRLTPTSSPWGTSNANCNPCHNSSEAGWSTVANAVNHTAEMLDNSTITCAFCHETGSIGRGIALTTSIMVHNSSLEKNATKYNCTSCHTDTANRVVNDSRIIKTHYPGADNDTKANTLNRTNPLGCDDCHNVTGQNLHSSRLAVDKASVSGNANGTCYGCHQINGTFQNKSTIIYSDPIHRTSDNETQSCIRCHNYNGTDQFHFNDYPTAEVLIPGGMNYPAWANFANGSEINCTECHITRANTAPFFATNVSNGSTTAGVNQSKSMGQYNQTECVSCHVNSSKIDSYKTHRVRAGGGTGCGNTTGCHNVDQDNNTVSVINTTAFNDSGHSALNIDNGTNGPCYACHGDGNPPPEGEHTEDFKTPKGCDECHTNESNIDVTDASTGNGTGLFNASWIGDHNPWSSETNTTNATCEGCHIQAVVSGSSGNTSGDQNVSHYLYVPTLQGGKSTNNCSYCHKPDAGSGGEGASPSEKARWGIDVTNSNLANTTMGANDRECWICHSTRNKNLQDPLSASAPNNFHENTLTNFQWSCQACHPE